MPLQCVAAKGVRIRITLARCWNQALPWWNAALLALGALFCVFLFSLMAFISTRQTYDDIERALKSDSAPLSGSRHTNSARANVTLNPNRHASPLSHTP